MKLSSQHPPVKPCTGHMQRLLTQVRVLFFFFSTFLCRQMSVNEILHISYKDHITNKEVCAKIQQAIGPSVDLLTIVKRCKLKWYGNVSCSSGLVKTSLQDTLKGRRRQGRQKRGGKTTSGDGQAWSSQSPRGQWRTEKNGGNWFKWL